ncbi:MAG TPA: hypothetical protein VMT79_15255 [Candidatus Binatia bacterium]|nr:hypothetical protein [Candidatus Binatia bacterium]
MKFDGYRILARVDDLPGLIGLVQMGIVEIHTWNSRVDQLEQPNRIVLDLDPIRRCRGPTSLPGHVWCATRSRQRASRASSRPRAARATTSWSRSCQGLVGRSARDSRGGWPRPWPRASPRDLWRPWPEPLAGARSSSTISGTREARRR